LTKFLFDFHVEENLMADNNIKNQMTIIYQIEYRT
jgi:hypothetical protein